MATEYRPKRRTTYANRTLKKKGKASLTMGQPTPH